MSEFSKPVEDLSQKAKDYAEIQLTDLKLRTAKGLSITVSKLVGAILILGLGTSLVLLLSFGLVLLLGEWIGSYAGAALLLALVLAIAVGILLSCNKRLFRNTFVPVFMKLFFSDDDDEN